MPSTSDPLALERRRRRVALALALLIVLVVLGFLGWASTLGTTPA